jgi:hypothetical protein
MLRINDAQSNHTRPKAGYRAAGENDESKGRRRNNLAALI